MNKILPWIGVAVIAIVAVFMLLPDMPSGEPQSTNIVIRDGIQYVTVSARGGYSPRISTIKSDIPTKLIMKTNNTYDCSSSLVIRSAKYRGMLPANGETEIDLGTPKAGEKIQGTCSMGMYSFTLNIN